MSGKLTFNVGEVRQLFNHANAAKEHLASYSHICDPKYHKGGKVKEKNGWPDSDNIDNTLIPACLDLVGDQGVFLMSNGMPPLLVKEGESRRVVAYAAECDPNSDGEWYDAKVSIFGGDDGVDSLPIEMFKEVMAKKQDHETFKIKITAKNIQVVG